MSLEGLLEGLLERLLVVVLGGVGMSPEPGEDGLDFGRDHESNSDLGEG